MKAAVWLKHMIIRLAIIVAATLPSALVWQVDELRPNMLAWGAALLLGFGMVVAGVVWDETPIAEDVVWYRAAGLSIAMSMLLITAIGVLKFIA
ncbi:hypothetical protein PhaeoP83_04138 (plasmid) [Phaeobacter inhibens]|uniref:Uncharacterized protein n=1 Tax=Phaeobacter inhibens TaxID=221822 RepID=A0ABM6RK89_9RHOB|nr:hypothetical protein [Phaeobacter inhibens]AUQ52356.1 hypothetical protein PhaeoP83_04138 [Phaeobacter inhibens]AUQ96961.1 hypothetical protein PhaeoP66_04235 [Phaeobacter inhibens]AUR22161.1 hypothetical protein PhaeoP80_04138 [Phaeobacter inhibens]